MSVSEVTDKMGLHGLRGRKWYIQSVFALAKEADNLYAGTFLFLSLFVSFVYYFLFIILLL